MFGLGWQYYITVIGNSAQFSWGTASLPLSKVVNLYCKVWIVCCQLHPELNVGVRWGRTNEFLSLFVVKCVSVPFLHFVRVHESERQLLCEC